MRRNKTLQKINGPLPNPREISLELSPLRLSIEYQIVATRSREVLLALTSKVLQRLAQGIVFVMGSITDIIIECRIYIWLITVCDGKFE